MLAGEDSRVRPTVVSASRRTDIPAFYSRWLVNRLRAGYCLTCNPYNPRQLIRTPLTPDAVVLALWTRDPRPLLPHLPELDSRGFRYYFLFTLTGYPPAWEPGLAPLPERLAAFRRLAAHVGPRRVLWRYDPIILAPGLEPDYHRRVFSDLACALEGHTHRAIVSFLDPYPRVMRRLRDLGPVTDAASCPEAPELLAALAALAARHGITLRTCAEKLGLAGRCLDDGLIAECFGLAVDARKHPGQRPACRCVPSQDVGAYDTCLHACRYCYATSGPAAARRNLARHDPEAPWLLPPPVSLTAATARGGHPPAGSNRRRRR